MYLFSNWTRSEFVPLDARHGGGTMQRLTSLDVGGARVILVVHGIATDLAQADQILNLARQTQTVIALPETPTKFSGQLVPPND